MKKILLAALAVFSLTSCSDYLDKEPDTEVTLDEVFSQKILQERWLGHCYSSIPDPYWFTTKSSGWDTLGDDMSPSERWQQWSWNVIPLLSGNWNTQTGWAGNFWAELPRRVRECLIFQQRATPVPGEGLTSAEVQLMKIETRFLIAYYYSLMLNTYGPFPFRPGYLAPTEFELSELMTGQSPFDEIVDWIDKELLEVSKLLPASYTKADKYGRATSIMCLAVRARMLLFAASPLVNGNPDYANHVDRNGVHLFSTSYDPQKWQRAVDACKLLIDEAHAAGHELYYEYNTDGTIDPFSSYQNLFLPRTATDCKEILFARADPGDYGDWQKHCSPGGSNGNGGLGVTQEYVDAFFMDNGLPIDDKNSGYSEDGFSTEDDLRAVKWEAGKPTDDKNVKNIAAAGTFKMYVHREPRFYVSVNFCGGWYPAGNRHLDMLYKHADNAGNHDAPQNGYLLRKRVHPNYYANPRVDFYRPGILYRLGEAYLNYAEALNEVNQGAEALKWLNEIRKRAGIRGYHFGATNDEFIHVENNQDAIRKIIHAERRVELGAEGGLRYDDLRRWKECEKVLNGPMHGMNFYGETKEDYFKRTPCQSPRVYKKQFYWMPVYQDEIDKNPNLVQAPYWTAVAD